MSDQSETPETEGFLQTNPLAFDRAINFARSLERRLSLAQTEIKGHVRREEDLKVRIAELEETRAVLKSQMDDWLAENHKTLAARDNAAARADQAQSRIAELEKADHLPAVIHAKRCEERAERAEARITKLESLLKRSQILYLPMDLQAAIDAALKDRV